MFTFINIHTHLNIYVTLIYIYIIYYIINNFIVYKINKNIKIEKYL